MSEIIVCTLIAISIPIYCAIKDIIRYVVTKENFYGN